MTTSYSDSEENLVHAGNGIDDSICPVCRGSTYIGETISCEKCEYWFHFECVGVKKDDPWVQNEDVPYFCSDCGGNPRIMLKRLSESLTHPYHCNKCQQRFHKVHEAMAHYLITHQVKEDKAKTLAQCSICEKDFENKHTLKRHIQRVHERKKNFKCSICSMTCLDNWKLKRHRRLHLNPNYVPIIRGFREKKKHMKKCSVVK